MVQFFKIPVNGIWKNFENKIIVAMNYLFLKFF